MSAPMNKTRLSTTSRFGQPENVQNESELRQLEKVEVASRLSLPVSHRTDS